MDRETLANIFEPFFTTKTEGKGTGLGLATVYGIVKQNGGFVSAHSEPGLGTTMKIYLPQVRDDGQGRSGLAEESPPVGGDETILIVEDERAILGLGVKLLQSLGYRVLAADTPSRALEIAERHEGEIDLLLTDIVLPEMNGRDLAERMRECEPDLDVLFMSGYTGDAIAHRGLLNEGVQFLQKPFSLRELAAKVRDALAAGRQVD
jgi:CheY-like chemotaxis protein